MPILEAMNLGCPVACSKTSSMPEVAGDAAMLFDPNDPRDIAESIHTLWSNDDFRNQLVALGKKQVAMFSVKKMAEVHLQTFSSASKAFSRFGYYYYRYLYDPLFKRKVLYKHRFRTR